ncbi:MAG: hypothetical protein LQ344_004310 [Seirophora lacunosa]|nr:MAG: hypothetical protein LQ344_004310 [Seirophora lacunosa]
MRSLLILLPTALLIPISLSSTLFPRADCNADNCLRALRRNNGSASPFCSTYIAPSTTTITTSTTLTIYSIITPSASLSLPPSPSNSSSLISTPTYATPCTSPSRLSSACTCLFSPTPAVPNLTITVPAASTTIPVCDPALPNGGITRARGGFADLINVVTQRANTTDPLRCCATCYRTPGCLTYELRGRGNATQQQQAVAAGGEVCALAVAGEGSIRGPGAGETCPLGVYEAYNVEGREVGLGPCVDFRGT